MRKIFWIWLLFAVACQRSGRNEPVVRQDFSPQEQQFLDLSREVINRAYFGTFITMHGNYPHPRVMEPFPPDSNWTVWLGTNRLSRKVKEIRQNPVAVLHYFDRTSPAYVTLYGRAYLVDDPQMKDSIWRPAWEEFYPGKKNYMLIRFETDSLEMINPAKNLPGDSVTWKPYGVRIRVSEGVKEFFQGTTNDKQ